MADEPRVEEGSWPAADGAQLWYRRWQPATPQRSVVLLHGFGEHGGRYDSLARLLTAHGLSVTAVDFRGHGRSSGRRGHIAHFSQYLDDIGSVLDRVRSSGQEQLVLFGHSFGGLVAVHVALRFPAAFSRLVIQSPLFEVGFPVPRWKECVARGLRWWPTLTLPSGLDPRGLSRDAVVAEEYRRDPWVHDRISVCAYHEIRRAMTDAVVRAEQLALPTLLLFGSDDLIVSPAACRSFGQRLRCPHRIIEYPGGYHELHHERVREDVAAAIASWSLANDA